MSEPPTPAQPRNALPRGLLVLLGMAGAVIVVAGMKGAAGILAVTFLALVLTIAAHPMQTALARHMPGWLATVTCLVTVYLLMLGLAVLLVVSAAQFASLLPTYQDQFNDLIKGLADRLTSMGVDQDQLQSLTSSFDLSRLGKLVTSALSGVVGLLSNVVLIVTLVLFMTIDGSSFPRHLGKAGAVRPTIVSAIVDFAADTRRYLLVSTVFGAIVAVLDTVAMLILGIPNPVLWGVLAFLTNYIPNIGFIIGLAPPAVLALLAGGPGLMIAVIVIYCVINLVIQSVIQPKVVGDAVGLSTTLTFLSLIFWSWVLGPLGAILAVPLSLLVRAVLVDSDPSSQWLVPLVANADVSEGSRASHRERRSRRDDADSPSLDTVSEPD